MFIQRDADSWIHSIFRAFVDDNVVKDPNFPAFFEQVWADYLPLIRDTRVPGRPMSLAQTWILVWIAVQERHKQRSSGGMHFHEMEYSQLRDHAESYLKGLFDYYQLNVDDWNPVKQCIQKDSQAGSFVGRDKIRQRNHSIDNQSLMEVNKMLESWNYRNA